MLKLTIDVSQLNRARAIFAAYPERLKKMLFNAMVQSEIEVTKELKDRVPVRSGTLRRSWNPDLAPQASASGIGFTGIVGSNSDYAAFIEFGFHGTEQVKAHERSSCFGRETRRFTVPAHSRKVDFAGKPYARPGLEAAKPKIQALHEQAVKDALQDGTNA